MLTALALLVLTACSQTPQAADGDKSTCNQFKQTLDIVIPQANGEAHSDQEYVAAELIMYQAANTAEDTHLQDKLTLAGYAYEKFLTTNDQNAISEFANQARGIIDACEAAGAPIELQPNVKLDQ